ncbi:MAG: PIN domain-containing protein [Candidatus Dormibacteraeota bacterium]|nr:PIN domain-containing protein [Candidatus Dormibacteraeota bacterium]
MTVVDLNVLLYAINSDDRYHARAHAWLEGALNGSTTLALPWLVIVGFLRLSTHPAAMRQPLSAERALGYIGEWLARRSTTVVDPTTRHMQLLGDLLREAGTAGNRVNDAHLAALALEHGASITSFDRDFLRFRGVKLNVPE